MQKKKVNYWQYILLACILGSIFILSSQSGQDSHRLSSHFIMIYKKVIIKLSFLSPTVQNLLLVRADKYVRKIAHVIIYMFLGGAMVSILARTRMKVLIRIAVSLSFCIIYAMTDEWHQYYIAGRGAQLRDVVIDSGGALIGILVVTMISGSIKLIVHILRNIKSRSTK